MRTAMTRVVGARTHVTIQVVASRVVAMIPDVGSRTAVGAVAPAVMAIAAAELAEDS
jgi:hypothetical protein